MNVKRHGMHLYWYLTILAHKTRAVTKPVVGFASVCFGKVKEDRLKAFKKHSEHLIMWVIIFQFPGIMLITYL